MTDSRDGPSALLASQWVVHPEGHTTRTNLLIHILTVPIFGIGSLALVASLAMGPRYAVAGVMMMAGAMAMQGRGHATEPRPPVRFLGLLDVLARIFAEQWIAFPRFVATGGFTRAWKAAA